jgi:hypothetical protein
VFYKGQKVRLVNNEGMSWPDGTIFEVYYVSSTDELIICLYDNEYVSIHPARLEAISAPATDPRHDYYPVEELDPINSPSHYCPPGLPETKDRMRQFLGDDKYRGYCEGNILKYLDRYQRKGKAAEDLKKIARYAEMLQELYV